MALPAIAGAFAKGLLGAGARGAAAGGFRAAATGATRAVAADAVKGGAKQGFKKFAEGMTGKTSREYQQNVQGINPDTGDYLTPEERKARFKGFATGTKPRSQKLLSGGPQQTVAALPPSGGVNAAAGADTSQEKVVNHLEKIKMYLEKLLIIEQNALSRLQDQILATAREDDRSAAQEEEDKQERGKKKQKTGGNPLVKGMKKKAQGIFGLLMDLAMKFVGFKILDWISKPENQEKVTKIVQFFQGVIDFATKVAGFIGAGFTWTVETIEAGIQGITSFVEGVKNFFSFDWIDLEGIQAQFQSFINFFTVEIPKMINGAIEWVKSIPDLFVKVGDMIVGSFLSFLGIKEEDAKASIPMPDPEKDKKGDGDTITPKEPKGFTPAEEDKTKGEEPAKKMERGGMLRGATHAQGGIALEAEGGEYVLNRRAVAAIGGGVLDRINFGMYPALKRDSETGMAQRGGLLPKQKYGYGGGIKYFSSNGGGNKILNPGQKYSYNELKPHHSDANTRRQDGYPKDYGVFDGTNIANAPNSKIPLPLDSEVIYKQWASGYGNTVVVKNNTGNMLFAHLSKFGEFNVGDKLKAGTLIGVQGSTGGNYADHLHLEAEKAGHEAFVNFITTKKPTHGDIDPSSGSPNANTNPSANNQKDQTNEPSSLPSGVQLPDAGDALLTLAKLLGGGGGSSPSGEKLNQSQQENTTLTLPGGQSINNPFIMKEDAPSFAAGFDEQIIEGADLGDNIPPFYQAVFPVNL